MHCSMLGDLPERLVSFPLTTATQGKDSILKISQKVSLKPWKFIAY